MGYLSIVWVNYLIIEYGSSHQWGYDGYYVAQAVCDAHQGTREVRSHVGVHQLST